MTMSANYYDLNFGKSSKTARRFETHKDNENEMPSLDRPVPTLHSARKALKFDGQSAVCTRRYNFEEQFNSRNQENHLRDINKFTASTLSSLPHPKSLRKRSTNRSPKRKLSRVNHEQALSVENHIKQMKFYVARIGRDDKPQLNNSMEENCILPACDFEIPPLPELRTPITGSNLFNNSLTTPPQLFSQTVHRDVGEFQTRVDFNSRIEGIDLSPCHFINDIRTPTVNSQFFSNPYAENHTPSGSNDDAWFYQQWKPRCIFPSTEE